MPRVLMLCYYFPPLIACGANRSVGFVENLPALHWEPWVLTVDQSKDPWVKLGARIPPNIKIKRSWEWNLAGIADTLHAVAARTTSLFGKDLTRNIFRDLLVPDQQIAWFSTRLGGHLAQSCDLIYASCSPFSSALSAVKISRATGRPLVLDFRDPWTLNNYITHIPIHQNAIECMERSTISACHRLILNTPGTLKLYQEKYPEYTEKMSVIPNGFDELIPVVPKSDGVFRIMHVGSFYGSRSPKLLLETLRALRLPVEFIQVGGEFPELGEYSKDLKISCYPVLPRDQALKLMGTASLLYLKQGREPGVKDYVAVAAKTYEYLATGLPILAEVPPGDNAELLKQYASNLHLVTSEDIQEMKEVLRTAYDKKDKVSLQVNEHFIREYDRKALTTKLAAVFDSLLKDKH